MKMLVRSLSSSAVKLICSVLSLSFQFARIGSASFKSLPWSEFTRSSTICCLPGSICIKDYFSSYSYTLSSPFLLFMTLDTCSNVVRCCGESCDIRNSIIKFCVLFSLYSSLLMAECVFAKSL